MMHAHLRKENAINRTHDSLLYLRRIAAGVIDQGKTDGQLLDAFLSHHDETSLRTILNRHGPMVFSVCRRVLGNEQDAEDAFQATFLVFVRKARSIIPREHLGNWLHGVSVRTALQARTLRARRLAKEKLACRDANGGSVTTESFDGESQVDAALNSLPELYRIPVVLCLLQGRSRREVARELNLPEGTLSSRLAKAKTLLATRLIRRGVALPLGMVLAVVSTTDGTATPPAGTVSATIKAALALAAGISTSALVSPVVVALMEGVLKSMFVRKMKLAGAVFTFLTGVALGLGALTHNFATADPPGTPIPAPEPLHAAKVVNDDGPPLPGPHDDLTRLVGTWSLVFGTVGARQMTPAEMRGFQITIAGDGLMTFAKGGIADHKQFVIALDAEKKPKQIRLYPVGKNEDKSVLGIYSIDTQGQFELTCHESFQMNEPPVAHAGVAFGRYWVLRRIPPEPQPAGKIKEGDSAPQSKKGAEFPHAVPPLFAMVTAVNKEKGVITLTTAEVSMYGAQAVRQKVEVEGKQVWLAKPLTSFASRLSDLEVEVKWLLVTDMDGKSIDGNELWNRLTPGTMVVRGPHGTLDPAFRQMLSRDVLHLVPGGKW